MIYKLLEQKDRLDLQNISLQEIKALVNHFSVSEEQFIDNKYKSIIEVDFHKKKIFEFLKNKNIQPSIPIETNVLILPILINRKNNEVYYLNQSILFENWNKKKKNYFLINYHFPNADIEDFIIIKNQVDNLENYNFDEIFKKYNFNNKIILALFVDQNKVSIFSRVFFKSNEFLLNKKIYEIDFKNEKDIEKLILNIQENYEDLWKSQNKINNSINININLKIDSNNYNLSQKLEKILNNFELINSYEIKYIDSKNIIYKITYNGLPDKLKEYLKSNNFKIDNSNDIWDLK